MSKTEDEVEREKKAVQAMIGAKGAAEKVLSRNDRLTVRLRVLADSLEDIKRNVGDLYIRTYRNKRTSGGEGSHVIALSEYIDAELRAIRELL